MAGEAEPVKRSIWQGREDESKDWEIWTGWATLGFADGVAEGRGRGAADATPASQSCPRSGSLGKVGSSWRSCSLPQAGGRMLCQQNLQVILRSCRAAGGWGKGAHMFLFSPRSPCKVSAQSDPPADFPSPSHAQASCPHPEGPLTCSHTHLGKMHLVGSMKR